MNTLQKQKAQRKIPSEGAKTEGMDILNLINKIDFALQQDFTLW